MLLAKFSEIVLKGKGTRRELEKKVAYSIREKLKGSGASIANLGAMFAVELAEGANGGVGGEKLAARDEMAALEKLKKIFGIESLQIARAIRGGVEEIGDEACRIAADFPKGSSFALRVSRSGEAKIRSAEVAKIAGERVRSKFGLRVDLGKPDNEIFIYIREKETLVCGKPVQAAGGLPVGSQGLFVCCLLPGETALHCWMMAKRGAPLLVLALWRDERERLVAEARLASLSEWHTGKKMKATYVKVGEGEAREKMLVEIHSLAEQVAEKERADGIVMGSDAVEDAVKFPKAYFPLIGLGDKKIEEMNKRIGFE